MHSALFEQANLEVQADQRFALQNPQLLRVHLGGDVLAVKGAMVAYQGAISFHHEKSGSMGKMFKKVVSGEDISLMRSPARRRLLRLGGGLRLPHQPHG